MGWEGLKGLLEELSKMWHSSRVPCYSFRLFQHSSPCHHSNSGLGISIWESLKVSHHVYTGVLLQYTQYRYLCTSICHYNLRYTYRSYLRSYIQGTTCSVGSASWLPWLWASSDCVQRRASVSLLWDTFHMGWEAKHPILELCKRSEVP